MTGRNGRGSWEWQGITAFCTCQWIDWLIDGHMNIKYLMYLTGITMNKENSSDFMLSQVPWSLFWSYHYSDTVMLFVHTSNHVYIHNIHKITCTEGHKWFLYHYHLLFLCSNHATYNIQISRY
jgi:hypothetical protein